MSKEGEIVCLQETHSTPEDEKQWKEECEGEVFFSHGASNARGVMIYFAKNIEVELIKSTIDNEGRYIVLDCKIQGTRFLLYSIYAPNNKEEHKQFLTTIKRFSM